MARYQARYEARYEARHVVIKMASVAATGGLSTQPPASQVRAKFGLGRQPYLSALYNVS